MAEFNVRVPDEIDLECYLYVWADEATPDRPTITSTLKTVGLRLRFARFEVVYPGGKLNATWERNHNGYLYWFTYRALSVGRLLNDNPEIFYYEQRSKYPRTLFFDSDRSIKPGEQNQ